MPMPVSAMVKVRCTRFARCAEDLARLGARRFGAGAERDRPLAGEFHRIVGEVFQRRAQAQRVARHQRRQIGRERDFGLDAFVAGARGERGSDRLGQPPRRERLVLQGEALGVGLDRIDDQRGERGEVIGAALDRRRPRPLAQPEIGCRQQFGQRHDPGQRRADVVHDAGERGFDRAAIRLFRRARTRLARSFFRCALRHPLPRGKAWHGRRAQSSPTLLRISAALAPRARNSRKPVA